MQRRNALSPARGAAPILAGLLLAAPALAQDGSDPVITAAGSSCADAAG